MQTSRVFISLLLNMVAQQPELDGVAAIPEMGSTLLTRCFANEAGEGLSASLFRQSPGSLRQCAELGADGEGASVGGVPV